MARPCICLYPVLVLVVVVVVVVVVVLRVLKNVVQCPCFSITINTKLDGPGITEAKVNII